MPKMNSAERDPRDAGDRPQQLDRGIDHVVEHAVEAHQRVRAESRWTLRWRGCPASGSEADRRLLEELEAARQFDERFERDERGGQQDRVAGPHGDQRPHDEEHGHRAHVDDDGARPRHRARRSTSLHLGILQSPASGGVDSLIAAGEPCQNVCAYMLAMTSARCQRGFARLRHAMPASRRTPRKSAKPSATRPGDVAPRKAIGPPAGKRSARRPQARRIGKRAVAPPTARRTVSPARARACSTWPTPPACRR